MSVQELPTSGAAVAHAVPSRSERRKAATSDAIMAAARDLFISGGYHGVRVEDVAERADVSVGTIYLHFGNKENLYMALMEEAIATEESYIGPALEASTPLFAVSEASLRFYMEQPGYFRMIHFPPFATNPVQESPIAERLADRHQQLVDRLGEVIERRVEMGILRKMDGRRMAEFFWGAWTGVIALNLRPDNLRLPDEELVAVLVEATRILNVGILNSDMIDEQGRASIERILAAEERARQREEEGLGA